MTLPNAFTWLATALALVGFAIIGIAQLRENQWVRIHKELQGFKWLAAAALVALMAAIMHATAQVFG